jgi:hypothetical protein
VPATPAHSNRAKSRIALSKKSVDDNVSIAGTDKKVRIYLLLIQIILDKESKYNNG